MADGKNEAEWRVEFERLGGWRFTATSNRARFTTTKPNDRGVSLAGPYGPCSPSSRSTNLQLCPMDLFRHGRGDPGSCWDCRDTAALRALLGPTQKPTYGQPTLRTSTNR